MDTPSSSSYEVVIKEKGPELESPPAQVPAAVPLTKAQKKRKRAEDLESAIAEAKTKGALAKAQPELATFSEEEQWIRTFVESGQLTVETPMIDMARRKLLKVLAVPYNVDTKRAPKRVGKLCGLVLTRTAETRLVGVQDQEAEDDEKGGDNGKGKRRRLQDGDLIGQHAAKISKGNVGYQLLQNMGWAEGERIGISSSSGLEAPIAVVLQTSRLGLGAGKLSNTKP